VKGTKRKKLGREGGKFDYRADRLALGERKTTGGLKRKNGEAIGGK